MILFLRLLIAHLLADFPLQSDRMVRCRQENLYRSPPLYLHAVIHGALIALASLIWTTSLYDFLILFLVISATHLIVDLAKVYFKPSAASFFVDQLIHILILMVVAAWLTHTEISVFIATAKQVANSQQVLLVLFGALVLIWPSSKAIAILIQPFKTRLDEEWGQNEKTKQKNHNADGMAQAGMWIGYFERLLTYGFILAGYPKAIALVVIAKSAFRFGEIKFGAVQSEQRAEIEYILIGTMLSYTPALLLGWSIRELISVP